MWGEQGHCHDPSRPLQIGVTLKASSGSWATSHLTEILRFSFVRKVTPPKSVLGYSEYMRNCVENIRGSFRLPAPCSHQGRCWQEGCMPILRPCPTCLKRWHQENGRCRAQGCRGQDNRLHVPCPSSLLFNGTSPPRAVTAASVLAPLVGFLGTRRGGLSASHALLEWSECK